MNVMSGWVSQINGGPGCISYADVLNRWLPAAYPSMLTRSQVKERQVLIDKDPAAEVKPAAASTSTNWWKAMCSHDTLSSASCLHRPWSKWHRGKEAHM